MNLICPAVHAAANMEKPVYMCLYGETGLYVSLPTKANQFDFKPNVR